MLPCRELAASRSDLSEAISQRERAEGQLAEARRQLAAGAAAREWAMWLGLLLGCWVAFAEGMAASQLYVSKVWAVGLGEQGGRC